MSPGKLPGPAIARATSRPHFREQFGDQLRRQATLASTEKQPTSIEIQSQHKREAVLAVATMVAAGAVFTVHKRDDGLPPSFTFRTDPGGDLERCRAILREVKSKPPSVLEAFRIEVIRLAGGADVGPIQ